MTNTIINLIGYNEISCFKYLNQAFLCTFFLFVSFTQLISILPKPKNENMTSASGLNFDGVKYPNASKVICCSDPTGTVWQGLLSLQQVRVEGECFYFFCFFTFVHYPLFPLSLSFISSTISSFSLLLFSGR